MLLLLFETGNGRFALDCREVVEIIPLIRLKKIPAAPPFVAGIINYHSQAVPVLDLCVLTESVPCREVYSTRIVLVRYPLSEDDDRLVGLIAERVTDVVKSSQTCRRTSGVLIDEALNEYISQPGSEEMVQWFDIRKMLPRATMEELLYR